MIVDGGTVRIDGAPGLRQRVGTVLGVSLFRTVDQREVDAFAALTGDDQWIHVDVDRARASGFGGTIVHGYLLLSLAPELTASVFDVGGFDHGLNYGLAKLRFPAPLPTGNRFRIRVSLLDVQDVAGGVRASFQQVFEPEHDGKPVCVAIKLTQYVYADHEETI
jgi:acyl dehydratase